MRDVTAERAAEARAERRATALAATVEAQRAAVDLGAGVPAMLDVVALSALRALPGASGASVLLRRDRAARWLPDVVGSLDGDAVTGRLADGGFATIEVVSPGSPVANPAFDVTPARLVTGIITERGVASADAEGLLSLYPERRKAA